MITKAKEALGQNIKRYRKLKKLTQSQLAELIKRTESSIRKYEKGLIDVPNDVITEIAKALGVLPIDLLPLNEWDEEFNVKNLSEEVKTIEQVQAVFGKEAVQLLQCFTELNELGKQKALELLIDTSEVPKYKHKL